MNYIKHLTGFFDKVAKDKLLNPTHVSLYIALFQFWNCNRFKNPISISRDEIMRISKISSKATYHKCLKALHTQGYINYEPSYNPFKGSHVYLFNFADDLKPMLKSDRASPNSEPLAEQVADKSQATAETSPEQVDEQVVVPSINNTNNTNNQNTANGSNLGEPEKNNVELNQGLEARTHQKEEKSSAKKEESPKEMPDILLHQKLESRSPAFADYTAEQTESRQQKSSAFEIKRRTASGSQVHQPPELNEVLAFFEEQRFPNLEANKFFNYFQSIGWLVGGKTPMTDWPAAARNWMLNVPKYLSYERTDGNRQLDTSSGKNYGEPL